MPSRMGQAKYDVFEALFEREQPRLFRYALRKTGDQDVANDIVSEVFREAWVYRAEILSRNDDGRAGYLFTIARGRVATYWRTRRTVPFSQYFAVVPEDADERMAVRNSFRFLTGGGLTLLYFLLRFPANSRWWRAAGFRCDPRASAAESARPIRSERRRGDRRHHPAAE